MGFLSGKRALIVGLATDRSIAWGIAQAMHREGAELAFSHIARMADRTYVICIDTDPAHTTDEGGWWWEVAVPEVSERAEVRQARAQYVEGKDKQKP